MRLSVSLSLDWGCLHYLRPGSVLLVFSPSIVIILPVDLVWFAQAWAWAVPEGVVCSICGLGFSMCLCVWEICGDFDLLLAFVD